MTTEAILYTDGASRGNPGPAAVGVVLADSAGNVLETARRYVGRETNNRAEYLALIQGLELARQRDLKSVRCYLDSELVVLQMQGAYRVRNARLLPLHERARALCATFERCVFHHVARELNKLADQLANQAIDEHEGRRPAS